MPQTPHVERHFTGSATVRDIVIGKVEAEEVADIFRTYGLTSAELKPVVEALRKRPEAWGDFMMRFEIHRLAPDCIRLRLSGGREA